MRENKQGKIEGRRDRRREGRRERKGGRWKEEGREK